MFRVLILCLVSSVLAQVLKIFIYKKRSSPFSGLVPGPLLPHVHHSRLHDLAPARETVCQDRLLCSCHNTHLLYDDKAMRSAEPLAH